MELKIVDYGMNGEGVAKNNNKVILVENAIIGETVNAKITLDKCNYAVASTTEVLIKSDNRATPACPHYASCGGCSLQHMSYNEQLKFKTLLIKKTIKKILNLDVDVLPCVGCSCQYTYRNKVSFNFKDNLSGFYKEKSNDIVSIDNCLLADEDINKIFKIFVNFLKNEQNLAKNTQKFVKNLVIRKIFNQILIGVVTTKEIDLLDFQSKFNPKNVGIYSIINTRKDSVVLSGKTKHVFGIKQIKVENFGLTYFVDLFGFHQTNIEIQNKIYTKVLEYVPNSNLVVNGFSGQGLLSAILTKKAKRVIGIEINKNSNLSAEKLKHDNNLKNLTNILGDFNKEIKKYKPDILVLDPAKRGVGNKFLNNVTAKKIIYISCNPIAMCKDVRTLLNDYNIIEVTPFDMFPNTKNVETVLLLERK